MMPLQALLILMLTTRSCDALQRETKKKKEKNSIEGVVTGEMTYNAKNALYIFFLRFRSSRWN